LKLLGPSGNIAIVSIYVSTTGSIDDHTIGEVHDKSASFNASILQGNKVKESYEFYDHSGECVYDEFTRDFRKIFVHLGLQYIGYNGFWEYIVSHLTHSSDDNRDNYNILVDAVESTLAQYNPNETIDFEDIMNFDFEMLDIASENGYRRGREYILFNPEALKEAPDEYLLERDLVIEALQECWDIAEIVPDQMKDKELLEVAIECNLNCLQFFPENLYDDSIKQKILSLIEQEEKACIDNIDSQTAKIILQMFPELTSDDSMLRKALKQIPALLEHLSDDYRDNREFVKIAVTSDVYVSQFMSNTLSKDKVFISELSNNRGNAKILKTLIQNRR
jgi:hypothetical protein